MLVKWKIQRAKQDDAKFIRSISSSNRAEVFIRQNFPARLPRSREPRKFYKGFRGKARSRKPGSCEEAVSLWYQSWLICFLYQELVQTNTKQPDFWLSKTLSNTQIYYVKGEWNNIKIVTDWIRLKSCLFYFVLICRCIALWKRAKVGLSLLVSQTMTV